MKWDGSPATLPASNLRGDHRGSCVICLHGTDTALAFEGDAEWFIAGLVALGLSESEAWHVHDEKLREEGRYVPPGQVPNGRAVHGVRVCGRCVAASPVDFPPPGVPSLGVPVLHQRHAA